MLLAFSGKGPGMINVIQEMVFHKGVRFLQTTGILLRHHPAREPCFRAAGFPCLEESRFSPLLEISATPTATVDDGSSFDDSVTLLSDSSRLVHIHLSTTYKHLASNREMQSMHHTVRVLRVSIAEWPPGALMTPLTPRPRGGRE